MNRLTLGSLKSPISKVLGVCTTDSRIVDLVNECQERLMTKGRWCGTVQRYRICTRDSCLTWPRQIETIEAWWLCETPMLVRDSWYEAVANGPGMQSDERGCPQLIDRGTACCYQDPSGTSSFINVVAAVTESASAKILLQGYDENAQWIRTEYPVAGTWIDGENVTISTAGTRSTKKFTSLTGVIKPVTNGPVNLFEWPAALGANLQQLAYYESDETRPIYRRSLIPNLANQSACCGSQDDCDNRTVTVLAKLRHIPVTNDNDWLILQNQAAFKLMAMAILKEQRNLFAEAQVYEAKAIGELQAELSSHEGDGPVVVLRLQDSAIFGGGVANDIEWPAYY